MKSNTARAVSPGRLRSSFIRTSDEMKIPMTTPDCTSRAPKM